MSELKQRLEALLFSSGRSMSVEELSKLCRASEEDILKALKEIQYDYNEKDTSIMVVNEGNNWKLTTKEKYLDVITKIVTQTELSKSIMETLAVIAFRYPIKQSDLIKIRTNKAYEHLGQLEELGYISRQKHGRTKLIKLTQKFFDYFDLPPEKLKEKFHDFESIEKAIEEKEIEIERIKEEQKQKSEEEKKKQQEEKEKIEKEIDLIDSEGHSVKLEVVDEETKPEETESPEEETPKTEIEKEKLGELEIVDEPEDKIEKYDGGQQEGYEEKEVEEELDKKQDENKPEEGDSISLAQKREEEAEKRAEEILNPEKEEEKKETEEKAKGGETDEKESAEKESNEKPESQEKASEETSVPSNSEADKTKQFF